MPLTLLAELQRRNVIRMAGLYLVGAWVFELTLEGLKRDAEVKPEESIAPQTARRLDQLIIIVLLVALIYFGLDKFVLAPRREAALVVSTTQAVQAAAASQAKTLEKSIAVLPFVNLSSDPEQDYFSDGLSEDLITALSQLGVAHLLAGSVRRAGDVVRINADLVSVSDGRTLWSRPYAITRTAKPPTLAS